MIFINTHTYVEYSRIYSPISTILSTLHPLLSKHQ